MSNELKVSMIETIKLLSESGHSNREIARRLDLHRNTVNGYVREMRSKCANVTAGSCAHAEDSKCAMVTAGKSRCENYRGIIEGKLKVGLTAQRIYQDLVLEHGFKASYESVKRFVRYYDKANGLPFRRMECDPGEEVQVDFGAGAPIIEEGRRRRTHLFRIVLSHSRKAYSEAVFSQTSENFIRALENSFRYFGGVPGRVVIDNLRAAVTNADWFDPELNPKIADFARHYGTAILPAKPGIPRHKGKVERAVGYAQDNALKGRSFTSLQAQNLYLLEWEHGTADTRIHGTTKEQVRTAFEREKPFLKSLPDSLFPCFEESLRKVHRDGYVEIRGAYYSVPCEYVARDVWARWESHVVRIFNHRGEQIAIHSRTRPGIFSEVPGHISERKRTMIEQGPGWMMKRVASVGANAEAWARAMLKNRGAIGLRVLQGLLSMAKKYPAADLDSGCRKALVHEAFRLKNIRSFIGQDSEQQQFEFMDKHPLIRDLSFYGNIIKNQEKETAL